MDEVWKEELEVEGGEEILACIKVLPLQSPTKLKSSLTNFTFLDCKKFLNCFCKKDKTLQHEGYPYAHVLQY